MSGIAKKNTIPYFTHVRACVNTYAVGQKDWGGGYGHPHKNTGKAELANWTGMAIQYSAHIGTPGSVHTCWYKDDPDYDKLIANNSEHARTIVLPVLNVF